MIAPALHIARRAMQAGQQFVQRVRRSSFGYDAADSAGNGKRRAPSRDLRHEDGVLKGTKRAMVQGGARDATRNFSIAAWMVRSHVNYVTRHRFQAKTGNDEFDEQLEKLVAKLSLPENFDIGGRFCLSEAIAMTERAAFVDGDHLWVKLASGHVQLIESDLIRDQKADTTVKTTNGVVVDRAAGGRTVAYAVHCRPDNTQNQYEFVRWVRAENGWLHAYIDRVEQVRGVSPLAAALNPLRDVYEGIDLSMVKLKAESLFALKIKTNSSESTGTLMPVGDIEEGEGGDEEDTGPKYAVDFGNGPIKLEVDADEDAEFLQNDSPGGNAQNFLKLVILVVLKAADLPYSFFDESFTNFYGSRAAWIRYDEACIPKRERVARLLNAWTLWRLQLSVQDGELIVPEGIELSTDCWDWVPDGSTWWDPVKDVEANKSAVMAGFADPEKVTRKGGGGDIYSNLKSMARVKAFAEKFGIPLSWAPIPQPVQVVEQDPE